MSEKEGGRGGVHIFHSPHRGFKNSLNIRSSVVLPAQQQTNAFQLQRKE